MPALWPLIKTSDSQSTASRCSRICWPFHAGGTVKVLRYQDRAWYSATPDKADSIGYRTKISPAKAWLVGTGSLAVPALNCQIPFRFSQFVRTICGRGYSGSGWLVSTSCAQSVMIGAYCSCQAWADDIIRLASKMEPATKFHFFIVCFSISKTPNRPACQDSSRANDVPPQ